MMGISSFKPSSFNVKILLFYSESRKKGLKYKKRCFSKERSDNYPFISQAAVELSEAFSDSSDAAL